MRYGMLAGLTGAALSFAGSAAGQTERDVILYEREGTPHLVHLVEKPGFRSLCFMISGIPEKRVGMSIAMDGRGLVNLVFDDRREGSALAAMKPQAQSQIRIQVGEVTQTYSATRQTATAMDADPGRAAQSHLRAAMRSREGYRFSVGSEQMGVIIVPPEAEKAFDECVQSLLRGRMDELRQRLERMPR